MDDLAKLLANLDRDGVTELVIGTNRPVTVREKGVYVALTKVDVTKVQLARWLVGTAFEGLIPDDDGESTPQEIDVHGRRVRTTMTRRDKDLMVRIEPLVVARSRTKTKNKPKTMPPMNVPKKAVPEVSGGFELDMDDAAFEIDAPIAGTKPIKPPGSAAMNEIAFDPKTTPPVRFGKVPQRSRVPSQIEISLGVDLAAEDAKGEIAFAVDLDGPTNAPVKPVKLVEPGDWAGKPKEAVGDRLSAIGQKAAPGPSPIGVPAKERLGGVPPKPVANPFADDPFTPPLAQPKAVAPKPPDDSSRQPAAGSRQPSPTPPDDSSRQPSAVSRQPTPARSSAPLPLDASLASLVAAARKRGATDIHVAANRPVMIRAIGELVAMDPRPWSPAEVERTLAPLVAQDPDTFAKRGYIDLALNLDGAGRIRGNVSRQQQGWKGSFRLAYLKPPTLEELALPKELAKVVSHHQGLVVLAGPSGHGKTTTLAALVDLINETRAHHILTIEDPVEIQHPRKKAVVSQREVGPHTKSFAAALKASLREDPDVIVIGELRDAESVEIALTAAETGHLVMATMSTPSAAKTIDRLIDMFAPDEQQQVRASLAGALRAIVAQRLLPRADGSGVVPAVELLTGVLPLASLIREGRLFQLPNLMQRGRAFGMIRLDDSLLELARSGTITEEVAIRTADSKKEVTAALRPPAAATPAMAPPVKKGLGGMFSKKEER